MLNHIIATPPNFGPHCDRSLSPKLFSLLWSRYRSFRNAPALLSRAFLLYHHHRCCFFSFRRRHHRHHHPQHPIWCSESSRLFWRCTLCCDTECRCVFALDLSVMVLGFATFRCLPHPFLFFFYFSFFFLPVSFLSASFQIVVCVWERRGSGCVWERDFNDRRHLHHFLQLWGVGRAALRVLDGCGKIRFSVENAWSFLSTACVKIKMSARSTLFRVVPANFEFRGLERAAVAFSRYFWKDSVSLSRRRGVYSSSVWSCNRRLKSLERAVMSYS